MNQWICEDVGLVLNEYREKLDAKIAMYQKKYDTRTDKSNETYFHIVEGLNIARGILDLVEENWTSDEPAQYVLDKLEEKYNGR